jgi:hypothetical protein
MSTLLIVGFCTITQTRSTVAQEPVDGCRIVTSTTYDSVAEEDACDGFLCWIVVPPGCPPACPVTVCIWGDYYCQMSNLESCLYDPENPMDCPIPCENFPGTHPISLTDVYGYQGSMSPSRGAVLCTTGPLCPCATTAVIDDLLDDMLDEWILGFRKKYVNFEDYCICQY